MGLSQCLRYTIWLLCIILITKQIQAGFLGSRPKRQYGANMYLPDASIIPGGEGDGADWGAWSSPSECSRSCGGGVSFQTRECLRIAENGAPECTGGNTRYFSCNTQDCPEEEADFRSQQCARYNSVPFDGVYYDWVPYTNAPNPCELNCMPRGERFYYRQKAKVVDGTRCNDRELDVCVDGQCQPVGCDMMLGSEAKEDKCRKCGGDGGTCKTIADTYKSSNLAAGYNDILLIPSGATNIKIEETEPSNNYLASRNLSSHYYLNGNWRIDFPRPMLYAGCWWNYQRKPNGFAAPDQLYCSGPTTESLYIVMLVQDKTVSVDYEYSIPTSISQNTPDAYTWTHMEFSPCTAQCGGGTQSRNVTCNNRITLEEVNFNLCDSKTKPDETQECGQEPCAPHWVEEEWGKCSKGCGADGMQNRTVTCVRTSSSGERKIEEDSVCLQQVGNKPATTQECNRDVKNCPKYHLGPWTPCDKLCGEGKQKRKVTCYIEENGHKKVLQESDCIEEKPETEKTCTLAPCEGVDWIISEWSGCKACGQTKETRTAICGSKSGKAYPDEFCEPEVPLLSRLCKSNKCESQWFSSEWSKCSAACGKGVQSRIVICGQFDGKTVTPAADDSKCNADNKPKPEQTCEGEEKECPGQWFTGPWGPCSKTCGGGERVREVLCLANGTKSLNCDESKVEALSEKCNTQACTKDEVIPVDSTSKPLPEEKTTSGEWYDGEDVDEDSDEGCDDEESEEDEGNLDDEVELIERSQDLKLLEGVDLDGETTTASSLITDDLMLSDSPATDDTTAEETSTDISVSTPEGSTDITDTDLTEGSGDELDTTTYAGTELSSESSDTSSGATESTVELTTEVSSSLASSETTDTTEVSTSTETSSSTDASSTIDASSSTIVSSSSEVSDTTAASTETSETTHESSTEPSSTDSSTTDSSTTDSSTTETSTTDTSTTDSTSDSTSTESSSTETSTEYSTESSASTESTTDSSTESTESSTVVSSESTSTSTDAVSTTETESTTEVDTTTPELLTDDSTTTDITTDVTTDITTDISDSTTDSTESSVVSTETTDGLSTETSGSTESSVSTESSTEGSTESTISESESTESTITSSDSTTETLTTGSDISTESTSDVTTESDVTEESTTVDIWSSSSVSEGEFESSTQYTFTEILQTKKSRTCKMKKRECKTTKYGCCPDKKTVAKGPFDEGCPIPKTCADTKFGCCPDGVSPASGKKNKGCPKSQCAETLFGCCPDKYTEAEGENNEGCPEPTTLPPTTTVEAEEETMSTSESSEPDTTEESVVKSCSFSKYGCCPDGKAEAQGENFKGCEDAPKDCHHSAHGCCRDGRTAATGPNEAGCPACTQEPFGCCPDNQTPAHGHLGEGCCLNSPYGCCPDNINSARGPNGEDCSCEYTPYGCCPDKKTPARGGNNEGCGCETSPYGCCPDKLTAASGANFEGCPCHTMQYGCCPDGLTFAKGPNHYGCVCSQTEFKCCGDNKTPAKGPNQEGCTCAESKYGCCPDGITPAQDEKFEGCENVTEPRQTSCALPKETGPCTNYSIKYFYDTSYGSCAKFWYGGCEGNDNRFESETDCKGTCQEYDGKERCLLPKNSGPCTGYYKKWYFDVSRGRCEEFTYGGCYGTTNRFDSLEECQNLCDIEDSLPPCEQPADSGPCEGNFERWFYDNETDVCRPFNYGGCKGNKNNHPTEHACNYNCRKPGVFKDQCLLPKQSGDCSEQHPRWYYDGSAQKCQPFYYTGCGGNKNSFPTLESCETHCPKQVVKDICEIPAEVGECSNYTLMWYYDVQDTRCRQFYYGGCGGNEHKFATEEACLARCEHKAETTTTTTTTTARPAAAATGDICSQPAVQGECAQYEIQWYYNTTYGSCLQFYYGGCGGNSNRFPTETECEQRCQQQQPEPEPQPQPAPPPESVQDNVCGAPADAGSCDQYVLKWTFNDKEQRCQQFYYGGCEGNGNRFETEDDCTRRCSSTPPQVDQRFGEPEQAAPETHHCFLPADRGQCSDNETRWYYNSGDGICYEFNYSGCGGNRNSFASKDDCQYECDAVQPTCILPAVPGRCNDSLVRWYYDERSQRCAEFVFTGCDGNRNNFISERECLSFCDTRYAAATQQPESTYSICELPAAAGDCDNGTTAWFYDRESMACTAFTYSGCGGNGNRFETEEQCERQCGEYRGVDVCSEPVETGPCRQWQTRFYFNSATRTCEAFTYGGCEGTGNRFTDRAECESVCIVGQEPQSNSNKDICKLPVNVGKCTEANTQERRWYYDDERGACVSFIYSGCAGNQNNFRSIQACSDLCKPDFNEVSNEVLPSKCESYEEECRQLRCPYGVRRVALNDTNDCSQCECENPCENYQCPEGQQCAIDIGNDASRQFEAVCREIKKPGECPPMYDDNRNCGRECYNDADCRGEFKCCSNGCGFVCVRPAAPTVYTPRPTTAAPPVLYPGDSKAALEPKKPYEVDVQSTLGGIAVLRCFATGSPAPNVTWSTKNLLIDTTQGRFILTSSGDLTIVQVRQTDSGSYVCVASNGLGDPVYREVQLQVTETNNTPAYIYGNKNITHIGELSLPTRVRCPAGGNPRPHVTWWRNNAMMGMVGEGFEVNNDHSLLFKSVKLSDLGVYTCQAYNGIGRAASMKVILKAYGPARAVSPKDAPFLRYVIDPVAAPTTQSPAYPYRPQRPEVVPPVPNYEPPQRTPLINARAQLTFDTRNSNSPGSTVLINCAVEGYPTPNVTWTKNGVPLQSDERINLTENPYSVVINNLRAEDAGLYACTARNSFSYSSSEQMLNIESAIYVPPSCEDNPFYANCKLIVLGNYCNKNAYFARFCCKSCMLAGQLREPLPPLN